MKQALLCGLLCVAVAAAPLSPALNTQHTQAQNKQEDNSTQTSDALSAVDHSHINNLIDDLDQKQSDSRHRAIASAFVSALLIVQAATFAGLDFMPEVSKMDGDMHLLFRFVSTNFAAFSSYIGGRGFKIALESRHLSNRKKQLRQLMSEPAELKKISKEINNMFLADYIYLKRKSSKVTKGSFFLNWTRLQWAAQNSDLQGEGLAHMAALVDDASVIPALYKLHAHLHEANHYGEYPIDFAILRASANTFSEIFQHLQKPPYRQGHNAYVLSKLKAQAADADDAMTEFEALYSKQLQSRDAQLKKLLLSEQSKVTQLKNTKSIQSQDQVDHGFFKIESLPKSEPKLFSISSWLNAYNTWLHMLVEYGHIRQTTRLLQNESLAFAKNRQGLDFLDVLNSRVEALSHMVKEAMVILTASLCAWDLYGDGANFRRIRDKRKDCAQDKNAVNDAITALKHIFFELKGLQKRTAQHRMWRDALAPPLCADLLTTKN